MDSNFNKTSRVARDVLTTLGLIFLVSLLYAITGYFGLFLATDEFKYATAIWIPSGIALGSVLVWGKRILPGVFLGSLLINFYLSYNNSTAIIGPVETGMFVATGATLQTIFGYLLIRKWVGLNSPLNDPRDILLFTFFSGPLSCVVNTTFSNLIFLWLGILPLSDLIISWWTWYVGDTIGSLIFTPILVILFSKPYELWHSRIKTVLLPLCFSFCVLMMIYIFQRNSIVSWNQSWFILTTNLIFCVLINVTTFIISGQKNLVQSKMDEILCSVGEGIYVVDREGNFTFINPAVERMWRYPTGELIGKSIHDNKYPTHVCATQRADESCPIFNAIINNIVVRGSDEEFVRHDGTSFWMENTCSPLIIDKKITGVVVIVNDVDDRRQAAADLERLAHYDSLTGLPNRATFFNKLDKAIANYVENPTENILAVCFLDLDNFKQINDNLGHIVGDETLITVTKTLREQLRESDYIARLGGDEFAIILDNIRSEERICILLDKLIDSLNKSIKINKYEIHISMSIGIAVYPQAGTTGEDLLKNADIAMYHAKTNGKRTYAFFDEIMTKNANRLHQIDIQIRHALQRQELKVCYQFQVENNTNKIFGVEALIRWHNPMLGGEVQPTEFIPLIEKNGLIHKVGEWVLRQAISDYAKIQKLFKHKLTLSVNVSVIQFENEDFFNIFKNILKQDGITPSSVLLEITESALIKNPPNTIRIMNEIKKLGVNFALDDFGVDYSSMQYLKLLPISHLKIDASFVRDIVNNTNDIAIIKAIINLTKDLGISTVAEGVETFEQFKILKELNCNYSQGFYFSKPMTIEEILSTMKESVSE